MLNSYTPRQTAKFGLTVAALFLIQPAVSQPEADLKQKLDAIFEAPEWRSARWGVAVSDMTTSKVLYERDAEKAFMPASNMKIYTTAAALATLGADFKYETQIYASGTTTSNGLLRGDLIILGSGDPAISGRYVEDKPTTAILREWAQAVKNAGIRRIQGSVIGDDDAFDDRPRSSGWSLGYLADYYAAENSGLTINDNCWDAVIRPGKKEGDPAIVESALPTKYFNIKNHVVTSSPRRRGRRGASSGAESTTATAAAVEAITTGTDTFTSTTTDSDPPITIERDFNSNDIVLSGSIPVDNGPYKEWGTIHNGTLFATTMFVEELERQGVKVGKGPKDIDDLEPVIAKDLKSRSRTLLHTHISPPLSKIISIVNKPSQNFYADQVLKTLGHRTRGRGSFTTGELAVKDFLTTAGLDPSSLQMTDGSGLSRSDMVEPQMSRGLLIHMAQRPDAEVFENSLPIMGVDGTLRSRLKDTPAHKNVKAKTGTIGGVRSLSGYLTTKQGHKLAFSMMANNFTQSTRAATEAQDKALLHLIAYEDTATSGTGQ